jgi:hypothetical protein
VDFARKNAWMRKEKNVLGLNLIGLVIGHWYTNIFFSFGMFGQKKHLAALNPTHKCQNPK